MAGLVEVLPINNDAELNGNLRIGQIVPAKAYENGLVRDVVACEHPKQVRHYAVLHRIVIRSRVELGHVVGLAELRSPLGSFGVPVKVGVDVERSMTSGFG